MKPIFDILITEIVPHIRYVNDISYNHSVIVGERIIYDHEFIYCLSGETKMIVDGENYTLRKGDLCYIKPNIKNKMIVDGSQNFHAHCVHFDWVGASKDFDFTAEEFYLRLETTPDKQKRIDSLVERPDYEISDFYLPPVILGLDYEIMSALFKELYNNFMQMTISSKLMTKSIFLQIAAHILSHQLTSSGMQKEHIHRRTIQKVILYVKEHYPEDIDTRDMADYLGLSPKYFGKLFKEVMGVPFYKYLQDVRIQKGKLLLIRSDLTTVQIAEAIGLKDVYYFSKLFKKQERITPGKYRNMLRDYG